MRIEYWETNKVDFKLYNKVDFKLYQELVDRWENSKSINGKEFDTMMAYERYIDYFIAKDTLERKLFIE